MIEVPEAPANHSTTLDTNSIPLGESSWRAILKHVQKVGDEAETSYLEIKSTLDITDEHGRIKIGYQAKVKIAKFLLGAANRLPKDAARHFQGYAVLVVGAEKENVQGIPRGIEQHDLENALGPYLDSQFPGFELGRLPISETKEVLFIIAIPPEEGQPIYPCHKNYQSNHKADRLRDGAIYVRASSNTREAKSGEVLALVKRAQCQQKPPIDLEVSLNGPIYRVDRINEIMNSLYDSEEEDFKDEITKRHQQENAPEPFLQISFPSIVAPPSSSSMKEALTFWRDRRPKYISTGRKHLLGASLDISRIQVVSRGRFIAKPHLSVVFHNCEILNWISPNDADWEKMVEPVIRSTDIFENRYNVGNFSVNIPQVDPYFGNDFDNAWVTLEAESFRPDTPWSNRSATCILLARDISAERIEVTWSLTEDDNDEVTTGNFSIATEPIVDAADLVLKLFCNEK